MPVFLTIKQILAMCWRERLVALKFGAIPLAINLILVVAFAEAAAPTFASYATNVAVSLVSILAFAPFCVAWYRMVLLGKSDIELRPVFTLTGREFRFFGWTLMISLLAGLTSVIAIFVGAGIVIGLSAISPILGVIAGFIMVAAWGVIWLWILSRWSIALAMTAAGDPARLQTAWDLSKPYGWSMVGMQSIMASAIVFFSIICLAGVIPDLVAASRAKIEPPASALLTVNIVASIGGAILLWLTSTMYALVYRRITRGPALFGSHTPVDEITRTAEMETFRTFLANFRSNTKKETTADFREAMDKLGNSFPMPDLVTVRPDTVGGISGCWYVAPSARQNYVVLYIHGGGFTVGSAKSHGRIAADLSIATNAQVLVIDYALAPEHPFPRAIVDCVEALKGLLSLGLHPDRMALAGDSAGGGLVISTLLKAREQSLPRPAAAVCLSPWVNLACDGETYETKKDDDPIATQAGLSAAASKYLGEANPKDILASPYLADLTGLPPLLIQVGSCEVLLDDARRLANAAKSTNVDVTLEEWPGMIHNWHMFAEILTDGRRANARIGEFLRERWA